MGTFKIVIMIFFVIVSVAISVIVLMQQGKDAGLGSLSGQTSDTYWARNKECLRRLQQFWLSCSSYVLHYLMLEAFKNNGVIAAAMASFFEYRKT